MRRSLLSFGHLVSVALAWLTKPVLTVGIGPTPVAYGTLTPGVGSTPKPPRRRSIIDGNAALPFAGLKRLVDRVLRYRTASKDRYYLAAGRALAT